MVHRAFLGLFLVGCAVVPEAVDASSEPDAASPKLHCLPEAVPAGGFVRDEVYVEAGGTISSCATHVCMVFHLEGAPGCEQGDVRCAGPAANACFAGHSLCLDPDEPTVQIDSTSPDRIFCSCRCGPGGNSSLPLCTCPDAWRCMPDTDPGGGYCVPEALAIAEGVCASDADCAAPTHCDDTSQCR